MTSLVNDSLKFTSWYANMLKYFAVKMCVAFAVHKLLTFFQQKNIRILSIESAKTINEMTLNELVKLTTLWKTKPCTFNCITLTLNISQLYYKYFVILTRKKDLKVRSGDKSEGSASWLLHFLDVFTYIYDSSCERRPACNIQYYCLGNNTNHFSVAY